MKNSEAINKRLTEAIQASEGDTEFLDKEMVRIAEEFGIGFDDLVEILPPDFKADYLTLKLIDVTEVLESHFEAIGSLKKKVAMIDDILLARQNELLLILTAAKKSPEFLSELAEFMLDKYAEQGIAIPPDDFDFINLNTRRRNLDD